MLFCLQASGTVVRHWRREASERRAHLPLVQFIALAAIRARLTPAAACRVLIPRLWKWKLPIASLMICCIITMWTERCDENKQNCEFLHRMQTRGWINKKWWGYLFLFLYNFVSATVDNTSFHSVRKGDKCPFSLSKKVLHVGIFFARNSTAAGGTVVEKK